MKKSNSAPSESTAVSTPEVPFDFASAVAGQRTMPRALLIAAHPDDETIGAGVLLQHLPGVQIVHATDGSPLNMSDALTAGFSTRVAYAEARLCETVEALALAGVPQHAISSLHFTDQQASLHLQELTNRVIELVERSKPDIVLTHAYEGGHPDHDAVAFACHAARTIYRTRAAEAGFELCEFVGYHACKLAMCVYEFLPRESCKQHRYALSFAERNLKIQMLRSFRTQARTLMPFLSPQAEIFRKAPRYDFSRPPHRGKLFYENFDWGVDGQTWRKLAAEARLRMGILTSGRS